MSYVRSFLTGGGNNAAVQHFDIRPDSDQLIFHGPPDQAQDVVLRGTLVACLTEPLKANAITLKLVGSKHTAFTNPTSRSVNWRSQDEDVYLHEWFFNTPGGDNKNILPEGNHEFPFEVVLPPSIPESVEGRTNYWVAWRMKAVIDRGRYARNIEARRHLRVIRAPSQDSLELIYGASIDKIWPDKIKYEISITPKSVAFGHNLRVDCDLIPLIKGLKIGRTTVSVMEQSEITTENKGSIPRCKKESNTVSSESFSQPDELEMTSIGGAEGYHIERTASLPIALNECQQDVDMKNIRITHSVKVVIQLLNPAGHTSELRIELPIKIYIPAYATITSSLEVQSIANTLTPSTVQSPEAAPPGYGTHQQDVLYSDIDPQTYHTPGPSQLPSRSVSRRPSTELFSNLLPSRHAAAQETFTNHLHASLAATTGSPRNPSVDNGSSRNQSIGNLPSNNQSIDAPATHSESRDSRRASGEDPGTAASESYPPHAPDINPPLQYDFVPLARDVTHEHVEWPMDELNRVPSYNTAVQSSVQTIATEASSLPHYYAAAATASD